MPGRRSPYLLALGLGALHLLVASRVGIASDEAYYWQWSRRLDWGYHDHPPLVAYLIAAGTRLLGDTLLGVRLFSVLLWTTTLLVVAWLAQRPGAGAPPAGACDPAGPAAGLWAVGALAALPLFTVWGLLATPDVPLACFWILTVALTARALAAPTLGAWILTGAALALGLLSKVPMALLPPALLLALLASRPGRAALKTAGPWVAVGVGALLCLPMLAWMARHDFGSVLFQLDHGLGPSRGRAAGALRPDRFAEFLAGQAGAATPLLALLCLGALLSGAREVWRRWRGRAPMPDSDGGLLPLLVLPALASTLAFTLASLFSRVEANWTLPGYTTLAVLLGPALARRAAVGGRSRALALAAVLLGAGACLVVQVERVHPLLPWMRAFFGQTPDREPLARWARSLREEREGPAPRAPILAGNYQVASLLAYLLPDHPATRVPGAHGSGAQYALWAAEPLPAGSPAWYVTRTRGDPRPFELLRDPERVSTFVDRRLGVELDTYEAWFGTLR